MTYYLLPKTCFFIPKYIDCVFKDISQNSFISNSLSTYLHDLKEKIDYYEKEWDMFKKYTNPNE